MFTTCAFTFAVGVYQALYEEMAQEAHSPFVGQSTARIGLIGTLAVALMSMGGPLAVTVAGGWVFGITYILASFNQRLWHFALTQDVLLGIGASMVYVSTISVALTWFDQRRGLAMGIFISGSGVGGIHCQAAYISRFPASLIELFGVQYLTSVNGVLVPHSGDGSVDRDAVDWNADSSVTALVSSIVYDRVGIVCGVLLFAATLACVSVRIDATLGEVGRWKA
ncbi:hypothetical protein KXX16_000834 [Aspergillus fumigatus]|nr:hypothetical protein KXX14_000281 [Aspergillus fumigatus]KAH1584036.1 hypothetical protein KXX69_000785 [Aspergillus fumigatus]KAH1646039.1 hypothetical protein KXX16_000834 [Aspergillus fumigatus]KAH1915733.1 hypothetical protein KXW47_002858 [Aspergillus fumigatus]KAH1967773.1 hypothetical protein KXX04_000536 [Aspergillus fumigatus]